MPTLDNLATRFAHCVSLFRDPSAKTEQKKEFRALLGLLQETAVTLRLASGGSGIELNGVPCEGAGVAARRSRRPPSPRTATPTASPPPPRRPRRGPLGRPGWSGGGGGGGAARRSSCRSRASVPPGRWPAVPLPLPLLLHRPLRLHPRPALLPPPSRSPLRLLPRRR